MYVNIDNKIKTKRIEYYARNYLIILDLECRFEVDFPMLPEVLLLFLRSISSLEERALSKTDNKVVPNFPPL
jgi:hypothetical protein